MNTQNRYGGGAANVRFGTGGIGDPNLAYQQQMLMDMEMDMDDSYYDQEDYGTEIDMSGGQGMATSDELTQQQYYNYAGQQIPVTTGVDSSSGDFLIAQGYEVLDEELDENYEPPEKEILLYAKYLGMDEEEDKKYFYIAKEGLKAPLPGPWKPCRDPQNEVWYYNFDTKEMQQEHPCDDYYRKYFLRTKQDDLKKKEEATIKKQIKKQ